ncbi:MAG: TIGR03936 family radical SAM-associated protein [Lachnospiraceae bacterium]|nr:TIGR03936 family radical SAM-associated protein [Lachnospiraceae bacterium]
MKVRIKFSKEGVMRYIGHLDIMRYFQKCMRKADVDIAYSSGYSPHQIMSFASPLGVGLESGGEYFDIELNSGTSESVKNALNHVMVPGMKIISVRKLEDNVKNAMASIAAAEYTVAVKEEYEDPHTDPSRVGDFLKQDSIIILKQTKKSETEFDIRPHIYSFDYNGQSYRLTVDASSSGNIKPLMAVNEYNRFCNVNVPDKIYRVYREEIYTLKDGKLVSLESMGEEF